MNFIYFLRREFIVWRVFVLFKTGAGGHFLFGYGRTSDEHTQS